MIPVLLGVSFLVFTILSLTPGDPGSIILGITARPEDIAALNAEFGYDQPFFTRFFNYIGDIIFHFDLGTSYSTRQPVLHDISIDLRGSAPQLAASAQTGWFTTAEDAAPIVYPVL